LDQKNFQGRRAVITGGASGIGLATARLLARRGCRLVLADIETGPLDAAVEELRSQVDDVIGIPADVSDRNSVKQLATAVDQHFGETDILFLNAGVGVVGPVVKATHDDWAWTIDVNLWGAIHGVEAFLPGMVTSGHDGHVLFTASFAGLVPNVDMGPYCVTKYGIVALAEVLHRELRDTAVRVSVICPMLVDTNVGRAERNRTRRYGGPGRSQDVDTIADLKSAQRVLPAPEVAERIVDAIWTDRLYILTHPESRAMIARRFARIDAAFD
jgi:NAD(P)-dependent dehydrogenase (short-subunit alcohol dehydrogenase family)